MPEIQFPQSQPTASALQSYARTMHDYHTALTDLQRRLATEQSAAAMLPTDDERKTVYEQKQMVLDIAKARLRDLVDFGTMVFEKQIERPNKVSSSSAERANEKIQNGLKEVEDAIYELQYLMWVT